MGGGSISELVAHSGNFSGVRRANIHLQSTGTGAGIGRYHCAFGAGYFLAALSEAERGAWLDNYSHAVRFAGGVVFAEHQGLQGARFQAVCLSGVFAIEHPGRGEGLDGLPRDRQHDLPWILLSFSFAEPSGDAAVAAVFRVQLERQPAAGGCGALEFPGVYQLHSR